MVNSFLHTVPPVSSYSQIKNYSLDKEENIDNEKLSLSFSSVQDQKHHELATRAEITTNITNRSTLADPFVHAEETWSTYNNTANYINMIQSLRNMISFWMDVRQYDKDNINSLCSSSHQRQQQKNDFTNLFTKINIKRCPVITVTDENSIHYYDSSNNDNDNICRQNNLSILVNHQENTSPIMAIPLYRECASKDKINKNNNESHNHWLWSLLSSNNKIEGDDDNNNNKNSDELNIHCQATVRPSAQQKQPLWTFTHSYVRDTRINSAELRIISAEQNMIRNSKITRPLKNRQYQQRRKDDFVWGQRSCLRIVCNVGEIHK